MQAFEITLEQYREQIEQALTTYTPAADTRPAVLHQAMRYSLEAGGKRLRPCLLLAAAKLFPTDENPMPACAAIECLHTYSLIHDDLPCMDDSDLRRGRATCHKRFDEATALLAGDALLTHALFLLAQEYRHNPPLAVELVRDLGEAAGSTRLIGGQMEDLLGETEAASAERLTYIHENKTAALISASLSMGIRLSNAPAEAVSEIQAVGWHLGLAFQILDDLLDATSDANTLGKPVGADEENSKMTYPALFGLEESRRQAASHTGAAIERCQEIGGDNAFLLELMQRMLQRKN